MGNTYSESFWAFVIFLAVLFGVILCENLHDEDLRNLGWTQCDDINTVGHIWVKGRCNEVANYPVYQMPSKEKK